MSPQALDYKHEIYIAQPHCGKKKKGAIKREVCKVLITRANAKPAEIRLRYKPLHDPNII